VDASHSPFYSKPDDLSAAIRRAAGEGHWWPFPFGQDVREYISAKSGNRIISLWSNNHFDVTKRF
jgi:hypothetical protein